MTIVSVKYHTIFLFVTLPWPIGSTDATHDQDVQHRGRGELPRLRPRHERHHPRQPGGEGSGRELHAGGRGGLPHYHGRQIVDLGGQVS